MVAFSSDEELTMAMSYVKDDIFRIYIKGTGCPHRERVRTRMSSRGWELREVQTGLLLFNSCKAWDLLTSYEVVLSN